MKKFRRDNIPVSMSGARRCFPRSQSHLTTTRAFVHRVCTASCRTPDGAPRDDRSNDTYHSDRTRRRFSFQNGRGGWTEKRGVCYVVWRIVAAEVQALTDGWCQSDIGDPQLYKASPLSPLSVHYSPFLPTTTTPHHPLVLSHALRYLLSSPRPPSSVQVHFIHAVRHFSH